VALAGGGEFGVAELRAVWPCVIDTAHERLIEEIASGSQEEYSPLDRTRRLVEIVGAD